MKNDNNVLRFEKKLRELTDFSGVKNYPVEISELGNDLELSESESAKIADTLVRRGIAEYKAIGNSMIQLK